MDQDAFLIEDVMRWLELEARVRWEVERGIDTLTADESVLDEDVKTIRLG